MLITFLVLFGKALHDYVPAHAQQLIQALQDSEQQAQQALQQAFDHISATEQPMPLQSAIVAPPSQQGPLVVIHTAAPIAATPAQLVSQTAITQPSALAQPADPLADPPALAHVTGPLPGTNITYTGTVPANTSVTVQPAIASSPPQIVTPTSADYQGDTWTHAAIAAQKRATQ
jgi:hypothetical protein